MWMTSRLKEVRKVDISTWGIIGGVMIMGLNVAC